MPAASLHLRLARFALATVMVAGCLDEAPPIPEPTDGIGSEGGTITSDDGRATLVIPPGGLSRRAAVTLRPYTLAPIDATLIPGSAYSVVVAADFSAPATLTINYDPTNTPAGATGETGFAPAVANGQFWNRTSGSIDATNHMATIPVLSQNNFAVRWDPAPGTCTAAAYRAFDFWIGEWHLQGSSTGGGTLNGAQNVRALESGCGVTEDFYGIPGTYRGRSVSTYDTATGEWTQYYIDNAGGHITYVGSVAGGTMLLYETPTRRLGWTPLGANIIRHYVEESNDDGATWVVEFEGAYTR